MLPGRPHGRPTTPRRIECCAFICALLALHAPAAGQEGIIDLAGETMGTTYSLKVASTRPVDPSALHAEIDALLEEINDQMSTWRVESEISRFNRHPADDWFEVSPELLQVVEQALEVAADSGGAFDPTVSPLVGLWNFGADARGGEFPDDDAVNEAQQHVGYRLIEARAEPPALRKLDPEVRLDLSAIAKGHGVDRVAGLLNEAGFTSWMVEIGGEVRTAGRKPDGSSWRIGIEQPVAGRRMVHGAIALDDAALATSGDYRIFFEQDGQRYSHTIDPATGRPVAHSLASVSVLADDCMTADAWATTLMVLGPDAGAAWANERGIPAYFIIHDDDGFMAAHTAGFPTLEMSSEAANETDRVPEVHADRWMTFLLALVVFGMAVIGLALGVIVSNRRLRGSCGGLAGMQDEHGRAICDACSNPAEECDEFRRRVATTSPASESTETDSA